jgi:hypothetical protein
VNEVLSSYDTLQKEFPRAIIQASTFDNYVRDVIRIESQLPIVSQEVGDTWIHGSNNTSLSLSLLFFYILLEILFVLMIS